MITMRCGALIGVLVVAAACDGSSSTPAPHIFDGAWVVCRNDLGPDYREVFAIEGTSLTVEMIEYATTDTTCDGDGTSAGTLTAKASYGAKVSAALGAGMVEATQVNVTFPGPDTYYTILYRDAAATPEILYNGDDSGVKDGSSEALRPDTLQAELLRALQTAPVAADLGGTWSSCSAAGGQVIVVDAAARTAHATKWDGPCGTGTITEDLSMTYTLGEPVFAQHGPTTVTALAVDLVVDGVRDVHTTFWVDTAASPRTLWHGDDTIHGMDGSTPALRPRVLDDTGYAKQ